MGGAADLPQRSSSPLKRPASDLEAEPESSQNDVDMVAVPELAASEPTEASIRPTQPGRTQSVDMIRGETNDMQAQATAPDSRPKTGSSKACYSLSE
jgi:ubiquitin carboxyl-terminal hydrolase 4/11/15